MLYVNYITIKLEMLKKGQTTHSSILGLPLWLSWLRICLQCRRPGFSSWVGKIPWRRERLPTPVFWSGVAKSQTQLNDFHSLTQSWKWVSQVVKNLPAMLKTQITWVQSLGQEDILEKRMATHSSILAWEIPWTEEPGGYSPWGHKKIGHDWASNTQTHKAGKIQ